MASYTYSNCVGVGYEPCYSDDNRSVARMKFSGT
jgi:hypothetical protein